MSTRWYPIYQRGNPQLRVFLPNFWMKLVRTTEKQPENVVQFACQMQMTKFDIQNYLEKIYNIPVIQVRTRIALGPTRRDQVLGHVIKDDDIKYAYITLPKDMKFTFPDVVAQKDESRKESEDKAIEESRKGFKNFLDRNKSRPGVPGWYSI